MGAGRGVLLGVAGLVLKPTSGILAAGSQAAAYGADFCHLPVSIPVAAEDLSELLDKKIHHMQSTSQCRVSLLLLQFTDAGSCKQAAWS